MLVTMLLQCLFVVVCLTSVSPERAPSPKKVQVCLDVAASKRWAPLLKEFKKQEVKKVICDMARKSVEPPALYPVAKRIAVQAFKRNRRGYASELRGLAKLLGVNLGDLILFNFIFEHPAHKYCTSIVAQDTNGTIYHGRNFDFDISDGLQSLTIDVEFKRKGKVVFSGTTFVGYVGLLTGQRPNKFSITANEKGVGSWWENLIAGLKGKLPISWLVRKTLCTTRTFQRAVEKLIKTETASAAYIVIGGVRANEGMVMTRSRLGPQDIWPLDSQNGRWFLVQTNYDHWTLPPKNDDRRTPAIRALNATGQSNIAVNTLAKVLSREPVLNAKTVYTTVMSAALPNQYKTIIRGLKAEGSLH
ncbi:N-acylethanolamine-hydrolyzing acid amidase-like [Latimeria chalumnae]|uniref:N-acylethanolamine-hydrolyzing acid amidase n=1 Tax=Latimeria chalumnae TaxID=7897 RepID=H3AA70_LATCH|nr:PREDICTED: N-acylethanolamine-hydrolyzing acid amidase-like [Latimeria chalumnae]|eukprot:XP_006007644.1 PREDICTED: N-acylethanolamine-hydrolyzing acid amidase-like [Latimeria chalumnae]